MDLPKIVYLTIALIIANLANFIYLFYEKIIMNKAEFENKFNNLKIGFTIYCLALSLYFVLHSLVLFLTLKHFRRIKSFKEKEIIIYNSIDTSKYNDSTLNQSDILALEDK